MAEELWRTDNPCTSTQSYLHDTNWGSHTLKRPEIIGRLREVRETVEDPDFALRDEQGVVFKYRMGFGQGKLAGLWLLVIEEADSQGDHYIKSVYFTSDIRDYEVLCIRRIPAVG